MQLPIGTEDAFDGVIDLVRMRAILFTGDLADAGQDAPIPDELRARPTRAGTLIEALADLDDAIAEKYLAEREPAEAELRAAIRRG